ncbi:uncharacterized protein LAESUDRAFT_727666 [Laetiporus sulphureus 93-53]|uniref:Uncharacterized protein n=1 Tax=Laetiporus sulphureus 93-53 TaxID=1314785 RepID=A0A165DFV6_9APHY|nr:uncharacterized protein LAESUDRAFT_727666 [Laetiporus sulphureus 93-53]KZT04803.1 hypothetical protein LAESUDRAFT_727666 [Laetiporus sulphureus 93-53]
MPDREPPQVIPFDSERAHPREVDPAELVGKKMKAIYHVNSYDDLPSSVGIKFRDGSTYHVRMSAHWGCGGVDHEIYEDEFEGKQITECALLKCADTEYFDGSRNENATHIGLGIKFEGSDEWQIIHASYEEWDEDHEELCLLSFYDVFLVKMSGSGRKSGRGRGRGRR